MPNIVARMTDEEFQTLKNELKRLLPEEIQKQVVITRMPVDVGHTINVSDETTVLTLELVQEACEKAGVPIVPDRFLPENLPYSEIFLYGGLEIELPDRRDSNPVVVTLFDSQVSDLAGNDCPYATLVGSSLPNSHQEFIEIARILSPQCDLEIYWIFEIDGRKMTFHQKGTFDSWAKEQGIIG